MDYKLETTFSECAVDNMSRYTDYTVWTKLPNCIDGLKPVQRRIVWSIHINKKFDILCKETILVGDVMGLHPHGDASIADAIINLCQPFKHTVPLIYSESNIGAYANDGHGAAAMRYVDISKAEAAEAIFFDDTNTSTLHMVPPESEQGLEPLYLIPRIPTTMLIRSFGIASGCRTCTPAYGLANLCKLTKEYIKLRSTCPDWQKKEKSLCKYMIPDFPTDSCLRNSKALIDAYRKGDFLFPIVADGKMKIVYDNNSFAFNIVFSTIAPLEEFRAITRAVGSQMSTKIAKNTWEQRTFQQMEDFTGAKSGAGIMRGNFNCILRRGVNPFDVLAELKKRVSFSMTWAPEPVYVDNAGKKLDETPFTLLYRWYKVRNESVLGDLKQKLKQLIDRLRQLKALIIIVDHAKEVPEIYRKAANDEQAVAILAKRFQLTGYQARYISGLTMRQLTAKGRDDLIKDLEEVKEKAKKLQALFLKIDQLMIESIEKFEEKFVKKFPQRCLIPKYIGYARYKDTGYIMLENLEEMDEVLKTFQADLVDFELFDKNDEYRYLLALGHEENIKVGDDLPKYFKARSVYKFNGQKNTAAVAKDGGVLAFNGIAAATDNVSSTVLVNDKFSVITRKGEWVDYDVDDKTTRKSLNVKATLRDAVYVSDILDPECIVVHASSSQPNYLIIERIDRSKKLHKVVYGDWYVLAVLPVNTERVCINVPKEIRARCQVRHIIFENLGQYLKPGEKKGFLYGRGDRQQTSHFTGVNWRRKSTIVLAKPL